ncbi:hypothetical protein CRUP_028629, partial [Coryphaenoides rupestris]
ASKKAANRRQRGAQKACSNVFSMFEQSQIQEFKEAFGCIDQDRDGVIKKQDLKETYGQLGTDPEDTILAAFKLFDSNATGSINKDEWTRPGNLDYKSLCYIITHGDEKED